MRSTIVYGDYMHKITQYQQHTLRLITIFWDVMPFSMVNEYQSWKNPDAHVSMVDGLQDITLSVLTGTVALKRALEGQMFRQGQAYPLHTASTFNWLEPSHYFRSLCWALRM